MKTIIKDEIFLRLPLELLKFRVNSLIDQLTKTLPRSIKKDDKLFIDLQLP